jgi:hypothetical protein
MGLKGPSPSFIFGDVVNLAKLGPPEYDLQMLKKHGKIMGYFEGDQPVILTSDVKFIKAVMIKDFSHFTNRRVIKKNYASLTFLFIAVFML